MSSSIPDYFNKETIMKPKRYSRRIALALALTLLIPEANAALYKCTDEIGRVHYSQTKGELDYLCKTATEIISNYTKADIARWARLQTQYEQQVYRSKVRATAKFLDDVEAARRKK